MVKIKLDIDDDIYVNTETENEIMNMYLVSLFSKLLEEVDKLVDGMSPNNFIDEAKQYLIEHELVEDKESIMYLSIALFNEFKTIYPKLIEINFEDRSIYISDAIAGFEYGSAYKPALLVLTHSAAQAISNLED